jgi:hypothetical protein
MTVSRQLQLEKAAVFALKRLEALKAFSPYRTRIMIANEISPGRLLKVRFKALIAEVRSEPSSYLSIQPFSD